MKKRTPKVLVTGFDPFGGEAVNPSQLIVQALDGEIVAGHRVAGTILPTQFGASLPALDKALARHRPALVLALGQAGGREGISLERVAINLIDARILDNAGAQPVDAPVVENATNAYFSTLPLKAMLQRLRDEGIPASLSQTAGTFVCNQVFFGLMHRLKRRRSVRGGFVHVPYLPEQAARHAGAPSIPLEKMIVAVRLGLDVALTTTADAHYAAGSLD
ncbi:MAG TPA: pyroglutamyl-peptidase I [Rudaea sp.]|nr:pyroglutamyl-peptidase I [Rudaea sp.]